MNQSLSASFFILKNYWIIELVVIL